MTKKPYLAGNTKTIKDLGRNGWFIGHFIDECFLSHSNDVEVKLAEHFRGEKKLGGFAANNRAKTLSILISGHFTLYFRSPVDELTEEIELKDIGDYILWDNGVYHTWEANEDSVVLTVRWPSLVGDQTQQQTQQV